MPLKQNILNLPRNSKNSNNDEELVETRNVYNNTLQDELKSHVGKNLHISTYNYVQREH